MRKNMTDEIIANIPKSEYLILPKHWEYEACVIFDRRDYLLSIKFIDRNTSNREYGCQTSKI